MTDTRNTLVVRIFVPQNANLFTNFTYVAIYVHIAMYLHTCIVVTCML